MSYLPSTISLKLRMVSSSLTYLPGRPRKLLRDVERLREKSLNAARASNGLLIFVAQLVNAKNRNNVLQIFVTLQRLFHTLRNFVMFSTENDRVENARSRSKWIDRGINAQLRNRARKIVVRVQMRERGSRRRIGVIVSRHVNCLHRCNRTAFGRRDPLLQVTHFLSQDSADNLPPKASARAAPILPKPACVNRKILSMKSSTSCPSSSRKYSANRQAR